MSIDNNNDWMHLHRLGGDYLGQRRSNTADIDTSPGGQNRLQVVQTGGRGWVYINGVYQGYFSMATGHGWGLDTGFHQRPGTWHHRVQGFHGMALARDHVRGLP